MLNGHPVCAFEDHLLEIGARSSAKETAQNVAFQGINQLCFSNSGCPAYEQFGSINRDLPQDEL